MLSLGFVLGFAAGAFCSLVTCLAVVLTFRDLFGHKPDGGAAGARVEAPPPGPKGGGAREEFAVLFPDGRDPGLN